MLSARRHQANRQRRIGKAMSIIQQPCPGCARQLQLPDEAIGKTARCPACETTFRVALEDAQATLSDPLAVASSGTASAGTGAVGAPAGNANPYQATGHTANTVRIGEFEVGDVPFDQILSTSWAIVKARWVPLLLSMLVVLAIGALMMVAGGVVFAAIAAAGAALQNEAIAVVGVVLASVIAIPIIALGSAYLWAGWNRTILGIAQGHPSPLSELMPPMAIVWKMFWASLVLGALVMSVILVFGLLIALVMSMVGPDVAGVLGMIGLVFANFGFSLGFQFFLWPWAYILSQGRSTALGVIGTAFGIAMHNKGTTVLLVVISIGLSIAGTMALYVGLLFTTPISMLLFAVAYLMTTSQFVSNPEQPRPAANTVPQ